MNGKNQKLKKCLVGGAVGDALGLPYEGLSGRRASRLFKNKFAFNLIPFANYGMVSDDTEHAIMTVQSWIGSRHTDKKKAQYLFKKRLRNHLRLWFLCLPAGIGMATGRALFKLWLFLPNTGVFSAGNGPAMRAAVLGVLLDDINELKQYIGISTKITHIDPKAEQGAFTIALCSYYFARYEEIKSEKLLQFVVEHLDDNELQTYLHSVKQAIDENIPLSDWVQETFNKKIVTGYMYHTVPAVFYVVTKYPTEPMKGFEQLINAGGDVDTTCAIAGGIWGVKYGEQMLSSIHGRILEPKITLKFIRQVSEQAILATENQTSQKPKSFSGLLTFCRNLFFLTIVLLHGFRRLLPPY